MYTILGATGNTGSVVAETLLANGKKVRVIGRNKERLARFVARGAEAFEADVTDPNALSKAFAGASAIYALLPPDMTSPDYRAHQDETTDAIVKALETSSVTHVVALSSFGADKAEKTGPVVGLHLLEQRLAQLRHLNVLKLRAGYFMENTLAQVGVIKGFGMMAGPVSADLLVPMIATRDIGAAAADALLRLDFTGQQTKELLGERDLNYLEVAKVAGTAAGIPNLTYIQLPMEQVIQAMTQMGMSKSIATLLCEMSDAMNSGHMRALEPRSAANTTPTSYEQFVKEVFVPAFKGQARSA